MLIRCLYASRIADTTDEDARQDILEKSRKNNPERGITGLLCYGQDVFIQVLEGGRDEVCSLYNEIVQDNRHSHIRMLIYEEISERQFGSWKMGEVDLSRINQSVLLKYYVRPELDPFTCSGHATLALINELVATGSIVTR